MENQLKEIITEFLDQMGIELSGIEFSEIEDDTIHINLTSDEQSMLIGFHGENIKALDHLLRLVIKRKIEPEQLEKRILIDVDNYRKKQRAKIKDMAERSMQEVMQTRQEQVLPPMKPFERRLVHLYIKEKANEQIITESIGSGNFRQVVIKPKTII